MGDSPKPQEQVYDLEELESTYAGWIKDAEDEKAKRLSETRSRLAASGLSEGAELWTKNIEELESAHAKYIRELEGSETFKLITQIKADLAEAKKAETPEAIQARIDVAQGDERAEAKVSALVPGAIISGSTQQAANTGDERAIKILEQEAKQSGIGFYYLGGKKITLNEFSGRGESGIQGMGAATAI